MFDKQKEIDTIKTEHNFFNVADPLPVNEHDEHDMHIKEHEEFRKMLEAQEETGYNNQKLLVLNEHIELHKQWKKRKK